MHEAKVEVEFDLASVDCFILVSRSNNIVLQEYTWSHIKLNYFIWDPTVR